MESIKKTSYVVAFVPSLRRTPWAGVGLFLLLLGFYILTMSGHTYASDEETMLAAGEQLVTHGSFQLPDDDLMNAVVGVDGRSYSRYGPGQSLAAVPFIVAGRALASAAPPLYNGFIVRLCVLLLPALVTATTGLLLYAWARTIGYSARIALAVGLLYGLTSLAWPYSRTFFAEPLATLFLLLCAYGMRRSERRWWVVAGAAAAGALAVKFQTLLALPLLAGYAALACWRGDVRSSARLLLGRAALGIVGMAIPIGLLFLYNMRLFGGALRSGYGGLDVSGLLGQPMEEGLYGLTISTGKGLLLFSPTILLGLLGLGARLRQQWREALLALALLIAHLAFYSHLDYWHGDGSWGPRYMVFVVPFLYLPAAGLLAALARRPGRLAPALLGFLAALSFLVQLLPVLVNFDTYLQISDQHERLFTPAASPIAAHIRIWRDRVSEWWLRFVPSPGTAVLRDGFSYSEGDRARGELLPRWTYADARIQVFPPLAGPLDGRIVVVDHRPWPLPRANFALLLDGQALDGVQRTDLTGQSLVWELRFQLTPAQTRRGAELDLRSDTWNPTVATQDNPRNEDLGLLMQSLELNQGGQPLALREALPIPPPRHGRRALWLWYQDTPMHHLFDSWIWYVLVAGLPPAGAALLLAVIGLPGLLIFAIGLRAVMATLRNPRSVRRPLAPSSTVNPETALAG